MATRLRATSISAAPTTRPSLKDIKKVGTTQRRGLVSLENRDTTRPTFGVAKKEPVVVKRQPLAVRQSGIARPLQVKTTSAEVKTKAKEICIPKPPSPVPMDVAANELSSMSIEEQDAYSSAQIVNIDEDDASNTQLCSEYVNDIYSYMLKLEAAQPITRRYMAGSKTLKPAMRATLIDWLIEVHTRFQLLQETLYLTVALIDRFLQLEPNTSRNHLQLVGVTAMFIASKYEEMYAPEIKDFTYVTDNAYTTRDIRRMEMQMLSKLRFSLGRPLPLHFLRRNTKAASHVNDKIDASHHALAKYLLELCLPEYEMCHYPPSQLAAAALCLSLTLLEQDQPMDNLWEPTLVRYSFYKVSQIQEPLQNMAAILLKASISKNQSVRKKYASSKLFGISTYPQLTSKRTLMLAKQSAIADQRVIDKYAAI